MSDRVVVYNGKVIVEEPTSSTTSTTTTSGDTTTTTTSGDTTTTTSGDTTTTTSGDTTTTTSGDTTTTTSGDTTTTTSGDTTTTTSSDTTTTTSSDITTTTTSGDTTTTTSGDTTTTTSSDTTTTTSSDVTTTTTTDTGTTSSSSSSTTTSSDTTTTTTSSSTTTSTTTKPKPGAIIWRVESTEAYPGDTVKVKVIIDDPNHTKLPISGVDFTIVPEGPLSIIGASETSDAYGAPITGKLDIGDFQFANVIGTAVESEDGKTVIELTIQIPEDCAEGSYGVDLTIDKVSDENGNTETLDGRIVPVDGIIRVVPKPIPEKKLVRTYAEIGTKPGFYFSHDDGTRQPGVEGGFSKDQVTRLAIYDVYEIDGVEQAPELRSDIDMSKINYHGLTPAKVYSIDRTNFTYDHDVQVYYDDTALVDKDGNPLYITAYIGVKGDANLNNVADGNDATDVLWYFGQISGGVGGTSVDPDTIQLSRNSTMSKGVDDPLEQLAAFLCDVDQDEWSADNWAKPKNERTLDGTDATLILKYYGNVLRKVDASSEWYYQCWNEAVPYRFGGTN
jgi:hypothetical protein